VDVERFTEVASMSRAEQLAKERKETDALRRQALELGIEAPHKADWWWEDVEDFGGSMEVWELIRDEYTYLTPEGKAGYRKLIRDELRKEDEWKRARLEWKVKMCVSIITAITGLAGAIIGIIAILSK
jgi:hypothetical protein